MTTAMIFVHVMACLAVILVVLLSKGKGADLGAAFGGSSQTVFGSQGAGGVLTKMVAICVGVFMMTSLGLAYISTQKTQATIMDDVDRGVYPSAADEGRALPREGSEEVPGTDTDTWSY